MDESIEGVLRYWFGPEEGDDGTEPERRFRHWFAADAATDAEVSSRFGSLAERAARGDLQRWAAEPKGRLALILLLDQVPRQIHRGTAAAFAGDAKACALSVSGIEEGMDLELPVLERAFFYMPLQHSESIEAQELSVAKFEGLRAAEAPEPYAEMLDGFARYAHLHRDIIARFGRFPHRNRSLGREDTPAEQEFLEGGGPRFGQ